MSVYTSTLASGLTLTITTEFTFGQAVISGVLLMVITFLIFQQLYGVVWH
jgi:hypothetical protein